MQAISRDILCYAIKTLSHYMICAHVHDELIIECGEDASLDAICEQMGIAYIFTKRNSYPKVERKKQCGIKLDKTSQNTYNIAYPKMKIDRNDGI